MEGRIWGRTWAGIERFVGVLCGEDGGDSAHGRKERGERERRGESGEIRGIRRVDAAWFKMKYDS